MKDRSDGKGQPSVLELMKTFFKIIIIWILTTEARLVLKKYKPKVIAITGSVGKTGTKDAIYSILSNVYFVRKSEKSLNSEFGVPLTILGVASGWNNPMIWISNILEGFVLLITKNHYPKWLILEVGADAPGDIEKISKWLKTDIVVLTHIGDTPAHIEFFESKKHLVREKMFLIDSLKKEGTLIINKDSTYEEIALLHSRSRVVTYGYSNEANIYASNERFLYDDSGKPVGINFKVNYGSNSIPVDIVGLVGFHSIYSILAAFAVAVSEDINLVSAGKWASEHEATPGRMKIIEGINDSTIFDDSYNSSPDAVIAALDMMNKMDARNRKIVALGDMLELGKHSLKEHVDVYIRALEVSDILYITGLSMKEVFRKTEKKSKCRVFYFESSKKIAEEIKKDIKSNDVILVKGSQGIRMEYVVAEIMAHPEDKEKLLVRQNLEWLNK